MLGTLVFLKYPHPARKLHSRITSVGRCSVRQITGDYVGMPASLQQAMHGRISTIRADELFRARLCMDMALLVVCFRGNVRALVVASSPRVPGDTWPVWTLRRGRLRARGPGDLDREQRRWKGLPGRGRTGNRSYGDVITQPRRP